MSGTLQDSKNSCALFHLLYPYKFPKLIMIKIYIDRHIFSLNIFSKITSYFEMRKKNVRTYIVEQVLRMTAVILLNETVPYVNWLKRKIKKYFLKTYV